MLVGPRSRAAVRLEDTGQVIRLDQGTTLRVLPPRQPGRPLLDLSRGIIDLFSPAGRPLDVQTPYVTAGVEGTEFFVVVDPSRKVAEVGVIEGQVGLENSQGRLSLAAGEAAAAQAGLAPRRIEITPRDQVRWAIYYPPAMWELPAAGGAPIDPTVYRAWQAWRAGDLAATVRDINAISSTERLNAVSLDYLAAILISLGRVDEARPLLDRSARLDPTSPRAPALRAIVEVARNQPQQAAQAADAAVTLAPASPAARIAQSYALQSGLRLEEARAALLAATPPDDPLVQARLAEVEFYLGNIGAARKAAERAIAAAPALSRPRSILGFVELAQFRFSAAEDVFRGAATLDPADPLPRLGLGLTAIRRGNLVEGTKELEIAVALNPSSSILRSYLGKAYAADWRYDPAFREWGLAQQLDPKDPTPWLYQALANRCAEPPRRCTGRYAEIDRVERQSRRLPIASFAGSGFGDARRRPRRHLPRPGLRSGRSGPRLSSRSTPIPPVLRRIGFCRRRFSGCPVTRRPAIANYCNHFCCSHSTSTRRHHASRAKQLGFSPSLNRPGSVTTNFLRSSPAMGLAF